MKGEVKDMGTFAVACLLGLMAAGPALAADIVVDHSEEKETYDCDGGSAVINGGNNVLTLRNCTEVTVNGGDNLVHAGTVRAINILGSGNRVNYDVVAGRGKPKVVNLGTQNEVGSIGAPQPDAASDAEVLSVGEGALDVDLGTGTVSVGGRKGGVTVAPDGTATVRGRDGGRVVAKGGRATALSGKGIVVLQSGQKETLDCGGGPASVVGNSNILTLRNCSEVSVTGNNNQVDAGEASAISVVGQSNQVTWTERAGGGRPDVSNIGKRNVVKRRP
jgi:cold shock CspA family protein